MLHLALLLALLLVAPAAHAGSWQPPVEGESLRSFSLGPNPYARGQHRGVDLAAAPGSPVRSACAGRVSFAGRVPGGGLTVSVRCARHVATYQQLGAIAVRRGRAVVPGMRIGVAGRSIDRRTRRAHVHLGARVAASGRYVDPLTLIGARGPALPPLVPARLPRGAPPGRPPRPGRASSRSAARPPRCPCRGRARRPARPRPIACRDPVGPRRHPRCRGSCGRAWRASASPCRSAGCSAAGDGTESNRAASRPVPDERPRAHEDGAGPPIPCCVR